MQIHEITKKTLNEVGLMTRLGAALGNQQAQLQTSTAALSQSALKQWNNKVMQLQQANSGMPVSDQEYDANLEDFVDRVMLQGRLKALDQTSLGRLSPAMDAVVKARNDSKLLPAAFEKMVVAANAARVDPSKSGQVQQITPQQSAQQVQQVLRGANVNAQAVAAALQQTAGGPLTATRQPNPIVNALLNQLGIVTK